MTFSVSSHNVKHECDTSQGVELSDYDRILANQQRETLLSVTQKLVTSPGGYHDIELRGRVST